MSANDLYIQNITVSEHDNFQVKFPNVFTNYPLGAVRVEDQRFIDWDHYKFTLWQTQLNFTVFCASSACGVSVEHMNAKKPMIRSIYRNMNLRTGKVKNYNNKTLISSPSFKIGTNLKINLNGEKDKPDVKPKKEPDIEYDKEHKQDVKVIRTKPNIKFKKEDKPDMNKITYEEEQVALI